MNSVIERLLTLRVRDIMQANVVQVSAHETMGSAAAKLLQHEVSGAPVVDEYGRCVGILSALDFVRRERSLHDEMEYMLESDIGRRSCYDAMARAPSEQRELVQECMTAVIQTVSAETPLLAAARIMCAIHVHRLPIVDHVGHAQGIVTTLDVVAALVNAVEE